MAGPKRPFDDLFPRSIDESERTVLTRVTLPGSKATKLVPTLVVLSGKESAGRSFKLSGEMVIGRSSSAAVYLDEDGVSRKHAKIVERPDGSMDLVDLGSTNGTFCNGNRVTVHPLADGDKIQLSGSVILKFAYQDAIEEAMVRALYDSATRDGLTGLHNKRHFGEVLKKEVSYARRNHVDLSLIMFDVDHFKRVNDTHGHPAGDYVLKLLSELVVPCVRLEDTVARYGGEEFAVVLREITRPGALMCAERIRRTIEQTPFVFAGNLIPVTVSLGVATYLGEGECTPEDMIARSDKCLYIAKRTGRNRTEQEA